MTTQQRITIQHINEAHATQRFIADQASREQAELDPRCLLIAIQVKIAEGRMDEARQMYLDWKKGN